VFGTNAGFFSWPDFSQAGKKTAQRSCFFEINLSDVFLTEKTVHPVRSLSYLAQG